MQLENARKVRGIPPQKVIIAENFVKFNKNRNPTIPRSSMDTKIKKTRRKLHKGQAVIEWLNTTEEICTLAAAMKKQQVILVSIRPPPFSEPVSWRPLRDTSLNCPASSPQSFVPAPQGISPLCSWGSRTNTRQHFPQGAASRLSRALPPGSYMLINPNHPFAPLAQGMEAASYHDDLCDISVLFFFPV